MSCHMVSKVESGVSQQNVTKTGGPSSPSLHNLIEIQFWYVHSPLQGLSFSSYSWMINQHLDALCCASWKFLPPASEPGLLGGISVCMGAILKPFFMTPSHAARCCPGGFPIPLLSVRLLQSILARCRLSWRMGGCCVDLSLWGADVTHTGLGSLCVVQHEGWLLCHPASTHSFLETWIFAIEGVVHQLLVRCWVSALSVLGTAVWEPRCPSRSWGRVGPAAAPRAFA